MYNPYKAAFTAITCQSAQRFYLNTAIEHTFLVMAVTAIAARRTIAAGKSARRWHDTQLVPFTLLAIAAIAQLFAKPEPKPQYPLLDGSGQWQVDC